MIFDRSSQKKKKMMWETAQIQQQRANHPISIAPIQPLKTEPSENDLKP